MRFGPVVVARILHAASVALTLLSGTLAGCSKSAAKMASTADSGGPSASATQGATSTSVATSPATPPYPGRSLNLGDKMMQEANTRPSGGLRADLVFTEFAKEGLRLGSPPKQHLGAPIGAAYCLGAESTAHVAISVCEYADETSAKKGRDQSLSAFNSIEHEIANREIFVNKATTLTMLQSLKGNDSEAESKRLVQQFAKL